MGKTLEALVDQAGGCGRYQFIMVSLLCVNSGLTAWTVLMMVFGALEPDWWCLDPITDHTGTVRRGVVFLENGAGTNGLQDWLDDRTDNFVPLPLAIQWASDVGKESLVPTSHQMDQSAAHVLCSKTTTLDLIGQESS
nr:hypothetical protein BaRGS_010964 [Batillaria attramentaria]